MVGDMVQLGGAGVGDRNWRHEVIWRHASEMVTESWMSLKEVHWGEEVGLVLSWRYRVLAQFVSVV